MVTQSILNQPEGQTLEFRRDLPNRHDLARIVCAFSNMSGGNLVLGIEPKNNEIIGLSNTKIFEIQNTYIKLISDMIEPIPVIQGLVLKIKDKKLFVISTLSGNLKPYCLRGKDKLNGIYVRIAKINQIATPQMIAELDRCALGLSYDATPLYEADIDDLQEDLIQEYINNREKIFAIPRAQINYAFLDNNNLIKRESGKVYPTVAAILCFSEKASEYITKAKIKCRIYEYEDKSNLLDVITTSGNLINQIEQALKFFRNSNIPQEVIKELILNAVLHRDYSYSQDFIVVSMYQDRFEVISPGQIPHGLSFENLGNGVSLYRNKVLYKLFSEMGYGFASGSGIQNINKILKDNNYKYVEFSTQSNNFVATIFKDSFEEDFSKEEVKIIDFLEKNEYINNVQCQKLLRIKGKQAQYILIKLVKKGKLVSIGEKKGRKYHLKD